VIAGSDDGRKIKAKTNDDQMMNDGSSVQVYAITTLEAGDESFN
jgi:hypothetical protein